MFNRENVFVLLLTFCINNTLVIAQNAVKDDFTDENFTANPVWQGDAADFQIITSSPVPSGSAISDGKYVASNTSISLATLLTPSNVVDEWRFSWASGTFNTSTQNHVGIILMSDVAFAGDYTAANWNGYYLRLGTNNAPDRIGLYRATTGTNSITEFKVGDFSTPDFKNGALKEGLNIRITRSSTGTFEMFYNTGFDYLVLPVMSAGTLTDNVHKISNYFGLFTRFTNPSAARRVYLDNIQNLNYRNVYTWIGGSINDWTLSSSWSPARAIPHSTDILQFNSGNTVTATNVPLQNISQMQINNNTTVNLQSSASENTLTIAGDTSTSTVDLTIPSGSALNINGIYALNIFVYTNAKASITGTMAFSNAIHTIDAASAEAVVFNNGAIFTQGEAHNGSVFTESGNPNSITFANGSTFVFDAQNGKDPFGLNQPSSKVMFSEGSLYKHKHPQSISLSGRTYGNIEIDFSGTVAVNLGSAPCTINNLEIKNGILSITASQSFNITGNMAIKGGTFNLNPINPSAIIKLNGTVAQNISGNGVFTLGTNTTLDIANTSTSGVILQRPLAINGNLIFTSGLLQTGNNTLTLGSNATIMGEESVKYVVGNLRTTRAVNTGSSDFGGIGVSIAAGAEDLKTVTITRQSGPAAVIKLSDNTSIARNWNISLTGTQPVNGRNITFSWVAADDNSKDLTLAQVWSQEANNQSWKKAGSQQNIFAVTDLRSITISTNNFSLWTVSDANNPLPVSFISFEGKYIHDYAQLTWITASELNNAGFDIERSADGSKFEKIGRVAVTKNQGLIKTYIFGDPYITQHSYYRLKQIDTDSSFHYSKIIYIQVSDKNLSALSISPNPTDDQVNIQFPSSDAVSLEVTTLQGHSILKIYTNPTQAQEQLNKILERASIGIYIIKVIQNGKQYQEKLIKW